MKTISIHIGINEEIDEDNIIVFDPKLYNEKINHHCFSSIININYKKTLIYAKPGIVTNSISDDTTIKTILCAGYPIDIREINKTLLQMTKDEAVCYLELNGYKRVFLFTRLNDIWHHF